MRDRQYELRSFRLSEIEHRYGPNVHIHSDPYLLTLLARLCAAETRQPAITELITRIYSGMLPAVLNAELPTRETAMPTRMRASHPEAVFEGRLIDSDSRVICVNLARAGTLPSQTCYSALNYLLDPERVRQDHVSISRATDAADHVVGAQVTAQKIGGPVDDATVLFPDPMGATGSTLCEAIELYRSRGRPRKFVALHCIVTPEYLATVTRRIPELVVHALRVDRGLSSREVLDTVPGTHWQQERGLNDKQYIVPGGGGFGEILNNAEQ